MAAGSGEQVDGDFVNYVHRTQEVELQRLLVSGISSQRKAYIQEELARRHAGVKALSVQEATSKYAESRSVEEVRLSSEARRYQNLGYTQQQAQALAQVSLSQGGMTFSPEYAQQLLQQNIIQQQAKSYQQTYGLTQQQSLLVAKEGAKRQQSFTKEEALRIVNQAKALELLTASQQQKEETKRYGVVSAVEEKKGLVYAAKREIAFARGERKQEGISRIGQEAKLTFYGVAEGIILDPLIFLHQVTTAPRETTKNVYGEVKGIVTAPREFGARLGTIISAEPSYSFGYAAGLYGLTKVPKAVTKVSDIVRTRGLTEVPAESIIAPEFYKGQTFPLISRGETAGQLLTEFRRGGAGYTAAPKPFATETIAGKGSSEIYGVYQAPKLSPQFLRVAGAEEKLFSFKFIDTLRPTATKITPTSFELIKGVSPSQRTLVSVSKARSFFYERAELGKSYIPFVKTEKEAIIPAGTPLTMTRKEYYFRFEGRRIPIMEFKTKGGGKVTGLTVGDVTETSSSRRIGGVGKITPYELVSISSISKKSYSLHSYKYTSLSPSISTGKSASYSAKGISGSISPSISRPSKPSISPKISYGISQKGISVSKGISTGKGSSIGRILSGGKTFGGGYKPLTIKTPKVPSPKTKGFTVFERRFGMFKPIGTFKSFGQAFEVGRTRVSRTLGATFKVTGTTPQTKTPFGFYRKTTPRGILFVEKRKFRLSKPTEISEIQFFRRKSKKKKKR